MGQNLAKVYIYVLWQAILVVLMKFLFIFIISAMILLLGCTTQTSEAISKDKMMQDKAMEEKAMQGKSTGNNEMNEKNNTENSMDSESSETMEEKAIEEKMMNDKTTMPETTYGGQLIAGTTTQYIRYDEVDFNKARDSGKIIYLYFYATWCPICRTERPTILSAFNGMNNPDAVGFEVHFNDGETNEQDKNAARKFGVSYQHTSIIMNSKGDTVYRSLSPISKEEIISEISKAKNT